MPKTISELQDTTEDYIQLTKDRPYLKIDEWSVADLNAEDYLHLGLSGSPTKVKKIENVIFKAKESKVLSTSDNEIDTFMKELIDNHTIG